MMFGRFSFKIIITIVGLNVLLGLCLDWISPYNLLGESGGKINYYLQNADQYDLVILGNSRARHQVIPGYLSSSSYSLTHNGMMLEFHNGLTHLLSDMDALPDTLLVHIDPFEINRTGGFEQYEHLKMYYWHSEFLRAKINSAGWVNTALMYIPLYRYNGKALNTILNAFFSVKNGSHDPGFMVLPVDSAYSAFALNNESPGRLLDSMMIASETYFQTLNELIEMCERQQVQLILFSSPLYFTLNPYEIKLASEVHKWLYSRDVKYFDFLLDKPDFANDNRVWNDQWHFNARGAHEFSLLLKDNLMQ